VNFISSRSGTTQYVGLVLLTIGVALVLLVRALPARSDVANGERAFAACAACHSTTGRDGVGPHLNGVLGRNAGSVSGFNYSRALQRSKIVWNEETLVAFISAPQKVVPGNRMPFSGLQDAEQLVDIVDYLKTLQ